MAAKKRDKLFFGRKSGRGKYGNGVFWVSDQKTRFETQKGGKAEGFEAMEEGLNKEKRGIKYEMQKEILMEPSR